MISLQRSSYHLFPFPGGCHKAASLSPFFFPLLLLLLIPLSCLLSGGQLQSNTTVSGSVGMQSADEPEVAHLCSVLLHPNTQQPD